MASGSIAVAPGNSAATSTSRQSQPKVRPSQVKVRPSQAGQKSLGESKEGASGAVRPTLTSFGNLTNRTYSLAEVQNLVATTSATARAGVGGIVRPRKTIGGQSKTVGSQDQPKASVHIPSDEEYDTDLEIDDKPQQYKVYSPERVYKEACKSVGVVASSFFIKNMNKEDVDMCHHGLGPKGTKALCIQLVSNTRIVNLSLRDNFVSADGAKYISDMLTENCYISDLDISENNIKSEGCIAIFQVLSQSLTLQKLIVENNNIDDNALPSILHALEDNSTLKTLSLSNNKLGSVPSHNMFKQILTENDALVELDLSWNLINARTGDSLLLGLKANVKLQIINLSTNGLTDTNCSTLSDVFNNNHNLHVLDVSRNHFTAAGAALLTKGLQANDCLEVLRIGGNPMGAAGCQSILTGISSENSCVKELDMSYMWVSRDFVAQEKVLHAKRKVSIVYEGVLSNYPSKGMKKIQTEYNDEFPPLVLGQIF